MHIKYLSANMRDWFMPTSSTDKLKRYEMCISDRPTPQLFISDVLLFVLLSRLLKQKSQEAIIVPTEHNASDLTELLQKSAVEHSDNISSARGARLWFCSHDCHNRL